MTESLDLRSLDEMKTNYSAVNFGCIVLAELKVKCVQVSQISIERDASYFFLLYV